MAESAAAAALRSPCRATRAMEDVQETTSRGVRARARRGSGAGRLGWGRARDGAAATAMSLWLGFARLPAGKQAKLLLFRLAIFVFETRVGKIECLNQYSIFVKKNG
jgi:hypothetical protein